MDKSYAITGAAGFIGRHTIAALIQNGQKVIAIDVPGKLITPDGFVEDLTRLGYNFGASTVSDLITVRPCDLLHDFQPDEVLDGSDVVIHYAGIFSGVIVPDVIQKIRNTNGPVSIYDPRTVRDYTCVIDTVKAVLFLIAQGSTGTFNIGTGVGSKNQDVYKLIGRLLSKGELEFIIESDKEDFLVPDIGKINGLGWKPSVDLESGLEMTVRQFFT